MDYTSIRENSRTCDEGEDKDDEGEAYFPVGCSMVPYLMRVGWGRLRSLEVLVASGVRGGQVCTLRFALIYV